MATIYGVNATKLKSTTPRVLTDAGESGGKLKVLYDTYTVTAAIATTDFLEMCAPLPKGARVLEVKCKSSDLGTTGDLNIGWLASDDAVEVADPNGFGSAIDANAAAISYSMYEDQPTVAGQYKKFTAQVQPVIAPSEITTATSGTIELEIHYTID